MKKKSELWKKKKKHNYLVSFLFYSAGKLASKVFFSSFCSTALKKSHFYCINSQLLLKPHHASDELPL